MEKGNNSYVDKFLRFISDEDKVNMDYFYVESLLKNYSSNDSSLLCVSDLSYEDNDILLNYSGYNYKHINAALRGTWNYEENGDIINKDNYLMLGKRVEEIIGGYPTILNDNIMVYRGVDLDYFKQYGIDSLEDLKELEGKYMLDKGFVSTSIDEDKCFFKKENEMGKNYNIKIEYMIPHEFRDGIFLGENSSYSSSQQEFLINTSNLSRVSSVTINDDNTAVVRAVIMPKELYDDYYKDKNTNVFK